jgi:hypothetical protein
MSIFYTSGLNRQYSIQVAKNVNILYKWLTISRRMDLFVSNMADTENVKSYMSYVQKYTKIIKIPTLKTYFS